MKPSPQEVAEARDWLRRVMNFGLPIDAEPHHFNVLLAATAPTPEPGGDLVETLNRVFSIAAVGAMVGNCDTNEHGEPRAPVSSFDAGVRAVVARLAALGMGEAEKALPDVFWWEQTASMADAEGLTGAATMRACVAKIIAPVLAAMAERVRAAEAERDEALRLLAVRVEAWRLDEMVNIATTERARADALAARLARVEAIDAEEIDRVWYWKNARFDIVESEDSAERIVALIHERIADDESTREEHNR